ncbi:MAG: hypothetical protein AAGF44_00115 [Pseudomonadota bacterium]
MNSMLWRGGLTALALSALTIGANAEESPPGWQACQGLAAAADIWPACAEAASSDCVDLRKSEGDTAWAACLKQRSEIWQAALVRESERLRAKDHPEGEGGILARWLGTRAAACHRKDQIAALTAQFGETSAAAAVFQCELASTIHEAMRLAAIR